MASSFCTWEDDCPILWLQLEFHSDDDNYRLVSRTKPCKLLSRFCRGEFVASKTRQLVKIKRGALPFRTFPFPSTGRNILALVKTSTELIII